MVTIIIYKHLARAPRNYLSINIDSTIAALGNKPVIEVYEANANQLIYTTTPEPIPGGTKLIIPPGNINVR